MLLGSHPVEQVQDHARIHARAVRLDHPDVDCPARGLRSCGRLIPTKEDKVLGNHDQAGIIAAEAGAIDDQGLRQLGLREPGDAGTKGGQGRSEAIGPNCRRAIGLHARQVASLGCAKAFEQVDYLGSQGLWLVVGPTGQDSSGWRVNGRRKQWSRLLQRGSAPQLGSRLWSTRHQWNLAGTLHALYDDPDAQQGDPSCDGTHEPGAASRCRPPRASRLAL